MATKPIKTDLFKFVTLRTPQLINEQRKDLGFIFHPDPASSIFLSTLSGSTTLVESRNLVRAEVGNLVDPLTSYLQAKAIDSSLYNFSSWLMKNRNTLTKAEVLTEISGVSATSNGNLHTLWDNLFYQVLTRKSSYVRQACIQLIIANNFVIKHSTYDVNIHGGTEDEFLIRLANAKVVIDKSFTLPENLPSLSSRNHPERDEALERNINQYFISQDISLIKTAIEELKDADVVYQDAYVKARIAAKKVYIDAVRPDFDAARVIQKAAQKDEDALAAAENRTPRIIPTNFNAELFEFDFESPFKAPYTDNLSLNTEEAVKKFNLDKKASFAEAIDTLNDQLRRYNDLLYSDIETSNTTIYANGSEIPHDPQLVLDPNCFFVKTINLAESLPPSGPDEKNIMMIINLGNSSLSIIDQNHELTHGATTVNSSQSLILNENLGLTVLRLFTDQTLVITDPFYNLSGEFILNNGTKIEYEIVVYLTQRHTYGCGKVVVIDGDPEEPTTSVDVELYGINKIGIADFRKVEQEVCCYLPGEVSHIENVMAKEYKERATRNLVSAESTTETTSESEIENLTDSTTTERNEMQSEVSTVLNEDQATAFGATTGVSGTFPSGEYFANAYADIANSSSSSQSNSNAQFYAQEITERTLERIVQKTSKKRTSRILKEFEENNKHGFDNREGVQHVSGVYRWVDIIYKNQLINYGKRLMYEFMVPEPSRFFKEAIIKTPNNSEDIFTIEKPIHPLELQWPNGSNVIDSVEDLDEENYLFLASAYHAEVTPCPSEFIIASKAISSSTSATNHDEYSEVMNFDEDFELPEGYKTLRATVSAEVPQEGNLGVTISVGTKVFGASGYWTPNPPPTVDLPEYVNTIPIAFSSVGFHAINIGIKIECKRTTQGLKKWQNETFNAIMNAYKERLQEYIDAKLSAEVGVNTDEERVSFNPLFNRAIEKRELKRICIEMLTKPFGNPMAKDNYGIGDCDVPYVKQDANFENHAAHVKFFEQAFDWEIMAYLFYPYYWAKSCDWKSLIQQSEPADPIFQAFLQSGMSRAVVPVRPGFEDAVVYYMETGDIWNGGDLVIDNDNDLYISIAEEMQVIEGAVEDEWETRVPTALNIIQKDTIGLNETGLPCCEFVLNNEEGEDYTNPIEGSDAQLGGATEPTP